MLLQVSAYIWMETLSIRSEYSVLISMISMMIFCPVYSLVVSRNLWLILLSKILLFLNLVKCTSKIYKILRIPNLCLFFVLQLQRLLSYWQICDFSPNKSRKTYLEPKLPPGTRNWQLIYPHWAKNKTVHIRNLCRKLTIFRCHWCLLVSTLIMRYYYVKVSFWYSNKCLISQCFESSVKYL